MDLRLNQAAQDALNATDGARAAAAAQELTDQDSGFELDLLPMTVEELVDRLTRALPDDASLAVETIFGFVEGNFAERGVQVVDNALWHFLQNPIGVHRVEVALLRSSFRAQAHLPHWRAYLQSVQASMQADGSDWQRSLRGMV